MADSYVCSGATMRCTMGTSTAKLTVLPSRTVFLTGKPMANISDHLTMKNLAPFGRCRSLGFPATASATAAHHGHLTPMPCMHNTPFPWMNGKMDYIVKGYPALLKSCTCPCMWGGTISLITNGQGPTSPADMSRNSRTPSSSVDMQFPTIQVSLSTNETELSESQAAAPPPAKIDLLIKPNVKTDVMRRAIKDPDKFNPYKDVAAKHLEELKRIDTNKLKGIPKAWRDAYIAAATNINNNYRKGGVKSVYSDIELAYNIYQLATSKKAQEIGLNNISHMMPYNVFEVADKVPGFKEQMPSKAFWDSFNKFVPLYTDVGTGAFYQPQYGYVAIPMTDKSIKRMSDSDWYKSGRFHHEYGHAYDAMNGLRQNPEFKKLFSEFKEEVRNSDMQDRLEKYINDKGGVFKLTDDELEKLGALSDSIQAASDSHDQVPPAGHSKDYYKSEDLQMAEFIAHMSENYWSGNDLFEELAPESYKKMTELLKKTWK